ncbi:pyruvate kinase [Bacillus sp. DJP31]|uniref:pyruvate kinase n=1 Tax=Bacillus sp. DJP31 TaxID=3409789 RepID=UPI003BB653B9
MIDRICTIGPASKNQEVLGELIDHGMTIVRLNLSHGDHESHKNVIDLVRQLSKEKNKEIKILADLQGPKIRIGKLKRENIILQVGSGFSLTTREIEGDEREVSVDYKGLALDVKVGSRILINDGGVELNVTEVDKDSITTIVMRSGKISSRKGVNVPGTTLLLPAITEKDKKDMQFLIEEQVDYMACSFIRKPIHLEEIKKFVKERTATPPKLMAKIETMEAIQNFKEICDQSDAIMIARGDLGVELPYYWIPLLQKAMIAECNKIGKFVVTATQMLQSMTENSIPTRAEVTDIFQAVLDGTSAVMLSAESASGSHPVESIEALKIVSQFSEVVRKYEPFDFEDMIKLINQELLVEEE